MKLKTLKDDMMIVAGLIGRYKFSGEDKTAEQIAEEILELQRQKAIKWVKELEDFTSVTIGDADHGAEMLAGEVLRKFFNITEEDLR